MVKELADRHITEAWRITNRLEELAKELMQIADDAGTLINEKEEKDAGTTPGD